MARWLLPAALVLTAACGRAWYEPIDPGGEGRSDGGDPSRAGDAGGGEGDDAGVFTSGGAAADTSLLEDEPAANFGARDVLRTAGSGATILVRFDLGILPAGSAVQAVTLAVSTSGAAQDPSSVRVYRVFEDWTEGDGDGAPGAASWELREPGLAWQRAGCGVGSRDAAARADFEVSAPGTRYQVDLPTSVVEGWIDDPASNRGLALIATSGAGIELVSSEGADPAERPALLIEWSR